MTTADLRWTPAHAPSVGADELVDQETYTGKHRKPGGRSLAVLRMMYRPRHRAR